ncbi:MAG TPA: hypothetical protein DCS93_32695, partial [Microscillaceae bacterium]|nr:hypothetical protein [Microscillaceae bacterium]
MDQQVTHVATAEANTPLSDETLQPIDTTGKINVVWFKRDLRLQDHAPLKAAIESGLPTLLIYIFEPIVQESADWNIR